MLESVTRRQGEEENCASRKVRFPTYTTRDTDPPREDGNSKA